MIFFFFLVGASICVKFSFYIYKNLLILLIKWNSFFILYSFSLISIFIYALSCLNECVHVFFVVVLFERGFVFMQQNSVMSFALCLHDEYELLDKNICPMHLKPCVLWIEDNYCYFFVLSKYQKNYWKKLRHKIQIFCSLCSG